jgi:hypothetical protein
MTERCPICTRPLGTVRVEDHHLMPKTFGGRETTTVHGICHQKIHATFSERDLQHYYHTAERILENGEMQKFVKWVANKPPEYYSKNDDTSVRKGKRRR